VSDFGRQAHWEDVYTTKDEKAVSWFQERPDISVDLIQATGVDANASIIDVGGGASRLVDVLIGQGFKAVTVLDLSEKALATSKARLDAKGAHVQWLVADITTWEPSQTYDVWHDRAALHFLTDPKDRAAYAERVHDRHFARQACPANQSSYLFRSAEIRHPSGFWRVRSPYGYCSTASSCFSAASASCQSRYWQAVYNHKTSHRRQCAVSRTVAPFFP